MIELLKGTVSSIMDSSHKFHQKTAALLDRFEPEFASYLAGELIDLYLVPAPGARYRWCVPATSKRRFAIFAALARSIYRAVGHWLGRSRTQSELEGGRWIARSFARMLPADCGHLIVAQDFLPYLWRDGVLAGKRFSVLLTRPPLAAMQSRLDGLLRDFPREKNLRQFCADPALVAAESEAFDHAERVITPHLDLGQLFPNLRKLEWQRPEVVRPADVPNPVWLLFPAPLAAREGGHAALGASERLGLPLLVCGDNAENLAIPSDQLQFTVESAIPWHEIAAIVHPTLFKTWPRLHLHALALGIPVIATAACGLEEGEGVTLVGFNDEDGLVRALERAVGREIARDSGRDTIKEVERESARESSGFARRAANHQDLA